MRVNRSRQFTYSGLTIKWLGKYYNVIITTYISPDSAIILHLIHKEKVDKNFGNMQHIREASIGEFNPSFPTDLE